MAIPLLDLKAQYRELKDELDFVQELELGVWLQPNFADSVGNIAD